MKRLLSLLLCAIMLLTLCACGQQASSADTTAAAEEDDTPKKALFTDVADLPIGNDGMTYAERRQLCLDFMHLQITANWKTNYDFSFLMSTRRKELKELKTDETYAGIFYQSWGFGNIYRWLEYYDAETGIVDFKTAIEEHGGMDEDSPYADPQYSELTGELIFKKYRSMMTFGNQCTSSACWSLGRVINSVSFGDTCDLTVYNGYIPVGCYTYGYEHEGTTYDALTIPSFGEKSDGNPLAYDTDDVIADMLEEKGPNALYDCYAQLKPGDILVNGGHAVMVKDLALFTGKDGSIDYEFSGVVAQEQVEAWTYQDAVDGVMHKQQGRDTFAYSFEQLKKQNYIPFTFVEYLDPSDPQDKLHLDYYNSFKDKIGGVKAQYNTFAFTDEMHGDGVEKAVTYCTATENSITADEFAAMVVGSNYSISDVFVTITDGNGQQLLKNIWRADFSNYREVPMSSNKASWETDSDGNLIPISDGVAALANGENTIEVTLQLCTGELLTAYKGTLK